MQSSHCIQLLITPEKEAPYFAFGLLNNFDDLTFRSAKYAWSKLQVLLIKIKIVCMLPNTYLLKQIAIFLFYNDMTETNEYKYYKNIHRFNFSKPELVSDCLNFAHKVFYSCSICIHWL